MLYQCKPMVRNSHNWAECVWVGLYEELEYAAKMVDKVAPWSKWPEGCSRRNGIRLVVCRCGSVYIKNFIFLIDTEEVGIYICCP